MKYKELSEKDQDMGTKLLLAIMFIGMFSHIFMVLDIPPKDWIDWSQMIIMFISFTAGAWLILGYHLWLIKRIDKID